MDGTKFKDCTNDEYSQLGQKTLQTVMTQHQTFIRSSHIHMSLKHNESCHPYGYSELRHIQQKLFVEEPKRVVTVTLVKRKFAEKFGKEYKNSQINFNLDIVRYHTLTILYLCTQNI